MSDQEKLSREEANLLARSIKKDKKGVSKEADDIGTMVMETTAENMGKGGESLNARASISQNVGNEASSQGRKILSYKDICLGSDNEESAEESTDSEYDDASSSDDSDKGEYTSMDDSVEVSDANDDGENKKDDGSPRCPIVSITKKERKHTCLPWKKSVIVKLLGKG
ncbi:hypothetical protein SESBI_40270 [Sesbania bispinosa]|nr:hypothetical protein SESBI_40270 [Sesbania bispinosa]